MNNKQHNQTLDAIISYLLLDEIKGLKIFSVFYLQHS